MAANGTQFVKIALQSDVTGFVKGFAEASTSTGKFAETLSFAARTGKAAFGELNAAADKLHAAGKKIAMFGVASGVAIGGAIISAAKIQSDIKNVETISKSLGDSMITPIIEMSRRLPQTAGELTQGLYNVVSSGFDGAKALNILNVSAQAASAGLSTTANASSAITAVLNAYGPAANTAAQVSDYLFQTVNLGVVTFDQLTGVIGQVVGTASAAKVPIQDLGAAIATMTLSGISADEAGTSMNRVLQSLIQPSDKLKAAWSQMSDTSLQTALSTDGLYAVMMKLKDASKGNISTLMDWFPEIRAARGALSLMSADGANYTRVQKEMGMATQGVGMTQKALAKQGESVSFQWKQLTNSIKGVGIEIGTTLLPAVSHGLAGLTNFVGLWFSLPGPLKAFVSYVGAASSAIMILGGVMLAFWAKSLIFNKVLGAGAQAVGAWGQRMTAAGGSSAAFGTQVTKGANLAATGISNLSRPFGMMRTSVGLLGTGFTIAGGKISEFGHGLNGVGSGVTKLGTGIGNLASSFKMMAGFSSVALVALVGVGLAMQRGSQVSADYAAQERKNLETTSLGSYESAIEKSKRIQNMLVDQAKKNNPQDIFDVFNPVKVWSQGLHNVAGLLGSMVGIEVDSGLSMAKAAADHQKALVGLESEYVNVKANLIGTWKELHPEAWAAGIRPTRVELDALGSSAKDLGVDLTVTGKDGIKAQQALVDKAHELTGAIGRTGDEMLNLGDTALAAKQVISDAMDQAAKSAASSMLAIGDVTQFKVDLSEGADTPGAQLTKFYTDSVTKAVAFSNNMQTLMTSGLNPATLRDMLVAGPSAAGDAAQAMVDDTSGRLIAIANATTAVLTSLALKAAQLAKDATAAAMDTSGQKTTELPVATNIRAAMTAQGGRASAESVAYILGISPDDVAKVAGDFGITLAHTVQRDFQKVTPYTTHTSSGFLNRMMQTAWKDALTDPALANVTTTQLASLFDTFTLGGAAAASKAVLATNLMPTEKDILIKVFGDLEATKKIDEIASKLSLTPSQKDLLFKIVNGPDAVANIVAYADALNLTPEQVITTLGVIGTPEAIAEVEKIKAKIEILKLNHIPINMDNVQAMLATDDVHTALENIRAKAAEPKPLTIDNIQAMNNIGNAINTWESWTPGTKDASVSVHGSLADAVAKAWANTVGLAVAQGGIIRYYANGGREIHTAQMAPAGAWRVWAEPETGGESYIPLGRSKRDRSMAVLADTADLFGMSLTPKSAQPYAVGGMNPPFAPRVAPGGQANSGAPINVHTEISFNAPVYGEASMRSVAEDAIAARDRQLDIELRGSRGAR